MICPVCKGSGVAQLPHVPSSSGGYIDEKYIFSGMECGACNGTGFVLDRDAGEASTDALIDREDLAAAGLYDAPKRVPTAGEQFREHTAELILALERSTHLPMSAVDRWIGEVQATSIEFPVSGRLTMTGIQNEFRWARSECRPSRDIFSMSVSREMEYDREMRRIAYHLDFLIRLFEHVERLSSE